MRALALVGGATLLCAGLALAGGPPPRSTRLPCSDVHRPLRVARVSADGTVGPWVAHLAPPEAILRSELAFDTYEPDVDGTISTPGNPIGGDTCGIDPNDDASTGRWALGGPGSVYPLTASGMRFDPRLGGRVVTDMAVAWTWPVAQNCALIIELYRGDELNDVDRDPCREPDYGSGFLGGVLVDLGELPPAAGYYTVVLEDIAFIGMQMPPGGSGFWTFAIGTYPAGGEPASSFELAVGTGGPAGTQPAWWGSGDNEDCEDADIYLGTGNGSLLCGIKDTIGRAGDDVLVSYIDGGLGGADGAFQLNSSGYIEECFAVLFGDGQCPDPLSPMLALWVSPPAACACRADVNGDCVVNQADLGLLLAAFGACPGDANYSPAPGMLDPSDPCINESDLGVLLADFGCSGT